MIFLYFCTLIFKGMKLNKKQYDYDFHTVPALASCETLITPLDITHYFSTLYDFITKLHLQVIPTVAAVFYFVINNLTNNYLTKK